MRGEVTDESSHAIRRGTEGGTEGTGMQSKLGTLWSSGATRSIPADRRTISRRERARGSDEAIVSFDPMGQHNPLASQGPLDWIVLVKGPAGMPLWL